MYRQQQPTISGVSRRSRNPNQMNTTDSGGEETILFGLSGLSNAEYLRHDDQPGSQSIFLLSL